MENKPEIEAFGANLASSMTQSGALWREVLNRTFVILSYKNDWQGRIAEAHYKVECNVQFDRIQQEGWSTLVVRWVRATLQEPFRVDNVSIRKPGGKVCVELTVEQTGTEGRTRFDMYLSSLFYLVESPEQCQIGWKSVSGRKGIGKLAVALLVSLANGLFDPTDKPERPIRMSLIDAAQAADGPLFDNMPLSEYRRWTVGIGYYESMGFYRRPSSRCGNIRMRDAPTHIDQDEDGYLFTPEKEYYTAVNEALLNEQMYQIAANRFHAGLASLPLMKWNENDLGEVLDNARDELRLWAANDETQSGDEDSDEERPNQRRRTGKAPPHPQKSGRKIEHLDSPSSSEREMNDEERPNQRMHGGKPPPQSQKSGPKVDHLDSSEEEMTEQNLNDALMDYDVQKFLLPEGTAMLQKGKKPRLPKLRTRENLRAQLRKDLVQKLRDIRGLGSFSVRKLLQLVSPKTRAVWTASVQKSGAGGKAAAKSKVSEERTTLTQFRKALELMAPKGSEDRDDWKVALLFLNGIANSPKFMRFFTPEEAIGKGSCSNKHVMFLFPSPTGLRQVRSLTSDTVVDELIPRDATVVKDVNWLRITEARIKLFKNQASGEVSEEFEQTLTDTQKKEPTEAAIL